MDHHDRCRLREQNLAFFSRVGAGVSHEMRNVLSIIGEYAGLLDDLLVAADRGRPLDHEKLKGLAANIARQVKKGTEGMARFSRFAHAADQATATVDLTSLLENTADLARRHASVAGGTIELQLPVASVPVQTNPFSLQHVVFESLQRMLTPADEARPVTIGLAKQDGQAVITVSRDAADDGEAPGDWAPLTTLVNELGGRIEVSRAQEKRRLTITLPAE